MKCAVIHDDCGSPYLIRFTIFNLFGFSLKLHTIIRSDRERELHDHPWSFWTLMLAGGYYEETPVISDGYEFGRPTKKTWYGPGTLRFVQNPYPHRLDLEEENPDGIGFEPPLFKSAVTLVFMYPKTREWGFHAKAGWTYFKHYINAREC